MRYQDFIHAKTHSARDGGFKPISMPSELFDFQRYTAEWSLWRGRAATFLDCGMGKTLVQLTWADNVLRHTNRPVLLLTPLAVSAQTVAEGERFGIECRRSRDGRHRGGIVVANYESLHHFDRNDFGAVVCDESSAIKSFDGKRRSQVTEFLRHIPYRLLGTATAAPNDFTEIGTSSEALGELGLYDMLGRFFVNDQNNISTRRAWGTVGGGAPKWRFKGHAEQPFWKWIASWARAARRPSDLGFSDDGFILPPLIEESHVVEARTLAPGMLFPMPAVGLSEEREERRRTLPERCEAAAKLADHDRPVVIWCHLNAEGDMLERIIPGSRQVKGSMSDEEKEDVYADFSSGRLRVLIIKPKIGAFGLNWQHCSDIITFVSHSFEQYYQAVRRCWRFGQRRPVTVHVIASEGEAKIQENLKRKAEAADRMFTELVSHMNAALAIEQAPQFTGRVEAPSWLSQTA